jgi:phosphoribosylanthranilate isomerase
MAKVKYETLKSMVRAKICGITRLEDALLAEHLGAWALGFILAPGTPRYLEPTQIRPISTTLGPLVVRVGVFVDTPPEGILVQMEAARLQVAQLHGNEPPEWAEQVRRFYPVIKAFKLNGPAQPDWLEYPADALMVDGIRPGSGQGYPLDWIAPLKQHPRLIIAGGLQPENLPAALDLAPYAVDVSSGVEAAPRLKDPHKLRAFLDQVAVFNGTRRNQYT